MQGNIEHDIDSKLKSMLEDAEVKPSPRVWKAIESRLDVAVPTGARRGAFVWGLSLAGIAAALAAVLLIQPANHSNPIYMSADAVALESNTEATVLPDATPEFVRSEAPSRNDVFASNSVPTSGESAGNVQAETAAQTESFAQPETFVQAESPARHETEPAVKKESPSTGGSGKVSAGSHVSNILDPLADMDVEKEESVKDPLSFSAKGALGQNIGTGAIVNRPLRAFGIQEDKGPRTGIYESGASTYGFPLTFGLGLNIPLSKKLSIGTGFDYSLLTRSFSGVYTEVDAIGETKIEGDIFHKMHYVGIPLDINYSIFRNNLFNIYAFVGGEIEYCFSNSYTVRGGISDIVYTEAVQGFQFSTEVGAGIEVSLNKHVGLFFAPSAHYYFLGKQPKSIRTEKQLMVGASLGVKFDL